MWMRVPAGPPAAGWAGAGWRWRTAPPGVCSRRGSRGWPGTGSSTDTSVGYTIQSARTGRYISVKRLHKVKSGGIMWFCFARKMLNLVQKNCVKNFGRNVGCLVIKTKAETKPVIQITEKSCEATATIISCAWRNSKHKYISVFVCVCLSNHFVILFSFF